MPLLLGKAVSVAGRKLGRGFVVLVACVGGEEIGIELKREFPAALAFPVGKWFSWFDGGGR